MASTKEIKRRIKSVRNTKKITKAMELVAASKMKRAVSSTLASRVYSKYSLEILESLSEAITESVNPLFVEKPKQKVLFLLVTSNRGLCGAYNAQVIRQTVKFIKESTTPVDFVTVGKKGDAALRRIGQNIIASFTEIPDAIHLRDILPIATILFDEFGKGTYDHVYVAYTDYVSALTQTPKVRQLLPISKQALLEDVEKSKVESKKSKVNYTFEPSYESLIQKLVEKLSRMQVYQMLLESMASEQSSRMVAMKNASEAAGEMIDDLTLIFNKARQSSITQEISEISAGMASVS
jgi:F-type H+-transporting ATPase subunit gamma